MRLMAILLALFGVIGVAMGVFTILHFGQGPLGVLFSHETNGGPGYLIGGVLLIVAGLYIRTLPEPSR